ncbi:hypothetical protein SHM_04450 [Spiroplasma ixodetis]|uniref:Uncharacterized protein n=1 Tax=Spiroplasma ixodetis TaxID=2141 RepID=A0ABM8BSJ3_9MOLU|nr:hypothetical protein SHM_04450 [Spiroplasma ixodetis]
MQDIAVQFEKHCWIHSVSLFPPQVHVGRSPLENSKIEETIKKMIKEQPVFKETINTGGNKQIIINNKTNDKENFLINYKKKNYL